MYDKLATEARQRWQHEMARRTPVEWQKQVLYVAHPATRLIVANIVWWDWFGQRTTARRWPHLDKYLNAWNQRNPPSVKRACIVNGLVKVGYVREYAENRV